MSARGRVDVRFGRAKGGRFGRAQGGLIGLSLLAAACATPSRATVSLRMTGNVRDASVTIDDQYVGALAFVAQRGVALPPGKHRITAEKAGYFPWDRIVDAEEAPISLDIKLTKIPD